MTVFTYSVKSLFEKRYSIAISQISSETQVHFIEVGGSLGEVGRVHLCSCVGLVWDEPYTVYWQ